MQNLNSNGRIVNIISNSKPEDRAVASTVSKPKALESVNPMSKVIGLTPKINLNSIKIIKKDGTKEDYNIQKVVSAIKKSAARMTVEFREDEIQEICDYVNKSVLETRQPEIEIFKISSSYFCQILCKLFFEVVQQ